MNEAIDRELAALASRLLLAQMRARGRSDWDVLSTTERIDLIELLAVDVPELREAARRLKPTLWQRLFKRRQLLRVAALSAPTDTLLDRHCASANAQRLALALGQLRFGVPVNTSWALQLHEAVELGRVTEQNLRAFLSTTAVDVNEAGEVLIVPSSMARRIAWSLWILALLSMCALTHATVLAGPGASLPTGLLLADAGLVLLLGGLYWLGPLRWRAESRLRALGF